MAMIIRIFAVVAFVVVTALAGRAFFYRDGPAAAAASEPKIMVRVAAKSLPVGTFLDEPEAPFAEWKDPVGEEMVVAPVPPDRDVIGAVIIAPIRAGEPIPRTHLLLPGQDGFLAAVLSPGARAVSIAVDAVSGNAGHIFPGDRVDLILTQSLNARDMQTKLSERWASETILEDVRVIAVDQDLSSDMTHRDGGGRVARTITLEVQPREAEKVALASGLGKLSLSLRSLLVDEKSSKIPVAEDSSLPRRTVSDDAPIGRTPTWAGDVSLVIKSASIPEVVPEAPAIRRGVRVFRGKKLDNDPQ